MKLLETLLKGYDNPSTYEETILRKIFTKVAMNNADEDEAKEANKQYRISLAMLAQQELNKENLARAAATINELKEIRDDQVANYFNSRIQLKQENYVAAIHSAERVLMKGKEEYLQKKAHELLARAYMNVRNFNQAYYHAKKADDGSIESKLRLATIGMGSDKIDITPELEELLESNDPNAKEYFNIAHPQTVITAMKQNNSKLAIRILERNGKIKPEDEIVYIACCRTLGEQDLVKGLKKLINEGDMNDTIGHLTYLYQTNNEEGIIQSLRIHKQLSEKKELTAQELALGINVEALLKREHIDKNYFMNEEYTIQLLNKDHNYMDDVMKYVDLYSNEIIGEGSVYDKNLELFTKTYYKKTVEEINSK